MTSSIFEQWLRKLDNELTRKVRKIILFIDNCAAYPHVEGLQSIELAYLPPNSTSEIQPCDQGIINTLKAYLCGFLSVITLNSVTPFSVAFLCASL